MENLFAFSKVNFIKYSDMNEIAFLKKDLYILYAATRFRFGAVVKMHLELRPELCMKNFAFYDVKACEIMKSRE